MTMNLPLHSYAHHQPFRHPEPFSSTSRNSSITHTPNIIRVNSPNLIPHPSETFIQPIHSHQYVKNMIPHQKRSSIYLSNNNYIPVNTQHSYAPQTQQYSYTHQPQHQYIPIQKQNAYYSPIIYQAPMQYNYPLMYQPIHRPIAEQSLNSNFNYSQANFEQNFVHCVLCDQTYKTAQKSQHLQKHRQKLDNIKIRAVDEQQLKRLQKYNLMNKKGLIVKPIVEPEQFNVQYKANEYILKKVNNYIDEDEPKNNNIAIQTFNEPIVKQNLGYNNQSLLLSVSPNSNNNILSALMENNNNVHNMRNTNNTRFNDDQLRIEKQFGYESSRFRSSQADKQTFKNELLIEQSFKQTERNSKKSKSEISNNNIGYNEYRKQQVTTKLKYRAAESYNQADETPPFRESRRSNTLERINQEQEDFKQFTSDLGYNS